MEYEYFLGMIKQYESTHIKAYNGNSMCGITTKVPKPFGLLIRDILAILELNLSHLVAIDNEVIVIMGLHPAAIMLRSSLPTLRNRIIAPYQSDQHFCCLLEYQVVSHSDTANWKFTKSLMIDFTSGQVMDTAYYQDRLANNPLSPAASGRLFGVINQGLLATVWQIVRIRHRNKLAQVA